jgi:hypothetical protein
MMTDLAPTKLPVMALPTLVATSLPMILDAAPVGQNSGLLLDLNSPVQNFVYLRYHHDSVENSAVKSLVIALAVVTVVVVKIAGLPVVLAVGRSPTRHENYPNRSLKVNPSWNW